MSKSKARSSLSTSEQLEERWYRLTPNSGEVGTQRFRDIAARELEVTPEQRRKAVAVIGF